MKILIWDYNGTLLDDAALCLEIENQMLAERHMGRQYTLEEYRDLFCFPVESYYHKIGYTFAGETYAQVADEFNALYDARFSSCTLVPGALDKLEEAVSSGYVNVIISACRQDKLLAQTRQLGIDGYFRQMLGVSDNLAAGKIETARQWLRDSGARPDDCRLIGDTLHDLETARALQIRQTDLVACGHQSYRVLKQAWEQVWHSMAEVVL